MGSRLKPKGPIQRPYQAGEGVPPEPLCAVLPTSLPSVVQSILLGVALLVCCHF